MIGQAVSLLAALLILAAFALQQAGRLSAEDRLYLILNLAGSVVLAYFGWKARNLGLTVLEGVWALISLWSLAKVLRRGASAPRSGGAAT
jgi:hypothetical protein